MVRAQSINDGLLDQETPAEEEELPRLRKELEETRRRLRRMEESSKQLLSNMSHELRTPITSIQGYVEGMLEGVIDSPDKQRRALEMIYAKTISMNRLITDMFHLSSLESRQAPFHLEPVPVYALKDYLREKFELDVEQAGHRLKISLGKQFYRKAICVNVDLERLGQVFTNLITNAFRYLPGQGGWIHIYLQWLDKGSGPQLLVRVKDNGSGIAKMNVDFIFDRFYTGDPERPMKKDGGSGLGLAICEEIVASHGGSIYAKSKPGQGAEFYFTIPIAPGQNVPESPKKHIEQS